MLAPNSEPDPRWTLAAVAGGVISVPEDWSAALSSETLIGLTALDPDLALLYQVPRFGPGRERQVDGESVLNFTVSNSLRKNLILGAIFFGILSLVVQGAINEFSQRSLSTADMVGASLYTLLFAWLGTSHLLRALIRSRLRFVPDASAPCGLSLDVRLVSSRYMLPRISRCTFQPTEIMLVNRYYPGESDIPMKFPRTKPDPQRDVAVLAIGTRSEFAILGSLSTLDQARAYASQSEICATLTARGVPILEAPKDLCIGLPPKPPLPDDKRRWKREHADIELPPLTPEELKILFDELDRPNPEPCAHDFAQTIGILNSHELPIEPTIEWLQRHGAGCDCEVISNTADQWGEWAGYAPAFEE